MPFQFNITLTEEDYLAFNSFHAFESAKGKKTVRKSRIFFVSIMVLFMVLVLFFLGWTTFSVVYAAVLGLFTVVYMLMFKKLLNRNIQAQIKRLKKMGKLPFDPVSTLEFHEDKLVEITAAKRTEQSYAIFERICLVKDRYVFLYHSSVGAYILPMSQIAAQADPDAFFRFLSGKCSAIENY